MVDTLDSGSSARKGVEVRLLSRAPKQISPKGEFCFDECIDNLSQRSSEYTSNKDIFFGGILTT